MGDINKLWARKKELESIIKKKQEDIMRPLSQSTGELSVYDQHPADIASELYEREKDNGLLELLELELEKVNDAIKRCNSGQYGICELCGKSIEKARLDRLLNTTLCSECAHQRQNEYSRPAEEDILSIADMADKGEGFQVAGYEFYE